MSNIFQAFIAPVQIKQRENEPEVNVLAAKHKLLIDRLHTLNLNSICFSLFSLGERLL